ncbi:MAG TPA: hypothetical protein ENK18_23560 [Deltaproteobacteria bacterium]|nr:hypothetical protein [Deltaproteobacteria bacterium]
MSPDTADRPPGCPAGLLGLLGLRVGAASLLCLVLGGSLGVSWLWSRALSRECAALEREELSLEEMGAIKRRINAYRRDLDGALELSGREASFLAREHLRVPGWLGVEADVIHLELRIPDGRACYNVSFRGRLGVLDGVARLEPDHLVIGRLDLTRLLRGRSIELRGPQVGSISVASLLDHTTSLRIHGGLIELKVDDPEALR